MRCIEGIFRAVWGAFMALFRWPPTRLLAMHLLLVVVEVWFGWPILLAYFSCLRLGGCQLIPPTPGNAWWPILLALVVAGILWESRNNPLRGRAEQRGGTPSAQMKTLEA